MVGPGQDALGRSRESRGRPFRVFGSSNPIFSSRVRLHIGAVAGDYQFMRRSANLSAEKLVLDYLGRVSSAAQRTLPKGDRLLFVGRTRAAIEKRCGPLAKAEPAKVMEMLAELGDPRVMVKKELERLETAHRGGAPPPPVVIWKPTMDDWKPTKEDWKSTGEDWKPAKDDTEPIPRQTGQPPESVPPGSLPPGSLPPGSVPPGSVPPGSVPPGQAPPASAQTVNDAGGGAPRVAPAPPPPSLLALARSHPLETVAVLVLGVGGLIIPLVWVIGGLIALVSRVWDARDKWLALFGPLIFVFAVLLAFGVLGGGTRDFFTAFSYAFDAYREYLIRAGAVLTAVYLAWRIRRGPRMRSLPPWQRPHRGPAR
jgi:hypothetical protein